MTTEKIAFIGCGRATRDLINGLVANNYDMDLIQVSDPSLSKLESLRDCYGMQISLDNQEIVKNADIVIFAAKSQVMQEIAKEISQDVQAKRSLVISLSTGIHEEEFRNWLGGDVPIVRGVINTPSAVFSGIGGLFANEHVSQEQKNCVESIFRSIGVTVWFDDEKLLDVVSVLAVCGPAYFFLLMEMLQNVTEGMGVDKESARILILQTAFGASRMALEANLTPQELKDQIISPNGITEVAVEYLENNNLRELFKKATEEAKKRCEVLSEILSHDE